MYRFVTYQFYALDLLLLLLVCLVRPQLTQRAQHTKCTVLFHSILVALNAECARLGVIGRAHAQHCRSLDAM